MLNFRCSIEHSTLSITVASPLQRVRPENVVLRRILQTSTTLPYQERCNSAAQKKKLVRGMAPSLLHYCE
jgi:hypothetical protein